MKEQRIPGIYGIDTRALTKKLREKGVMLGKILPDKPTFEGSKKEDSKIKNIDNQDYNINDPNKLNLVAEVSTKEKIIYLAKEVKTGQSNSAAQNTLNTKSARVANARVLLVDCGVKNNIIRCFLKRGVTVIRVPWDYDFNKESDKEYDGIFVSNGPGDPKKCRETIKQLRTAMKRMEKESPKPIFGICLGNQLLALAAGADTYKLKYGHRSQNQPCVEIGTEHCYITSQNHGYAVNEETLPKNWLPWFRNANDETNEGIKHKTKPFFSVQFHPEAAPGPVDTEFLFDKFVKLLKSRI